MTGFTHLHVHTEHSFLDGVPRLDDLCDRVLEIGQTAVAITDHGEVSGHLKFQKAALQKGVQPIFGMEGYFVDDVEGRNEDGKRGRDYDHITLLAISQEGLRNLWILSSRAYIEGMYYKPRIDWAMLEKHGEGIIATGGCLGGCVATYLIEDEDKFDPGKAEERMGRFVEILGDRFYMELHTFPDEKQRKVNKLTVAKASDFGIPMIAVSDSHYLRPEDWENHELLIAAQMKKKWNDPTRYTYGPGALHVMSEGEVREKLGDHLPDHVVDKAITNTGLIAEMAEGVSIEGERTYPTFFSKPKDDEDKLRQDALARFWGMTDRLSLNQDQVEEYRDRLNMELDLVISKGYAGYFLIIADVIRWAKEQKILIGPGRGSAGGSLLSFVLGITEIDPVKFNLLFERFLDPQQTALPDIDVDVPQLERGLVLKYLGEKYHIATIGTLNTLAPRILLNDLCRLLDIPHEDNQEISRIISATPDLAALDLSWLDVRGMNSTPFEKWEKKYPKLFELMAAFASHYRHAGVHAAAIVVNQEELMGRLPLRKRKDDVSTQMPMEDIEALGYLKMDFLGLRTLSTLTRAWEMARDGWTLEGGKPEPIHFYEWLYNWDTYYEDKQAYASMWEGRNVGVFQLDTEGFSRVVQRYKPESLEDMCAVVSLFRPGVSRAIDPDTNLNLLEVFLQKREGRVPVSYRHESLKPILANTYGAFLYQEQVMQAARDLADFTPQESTRLRKILGKTMPEEMRQFKDLFIERTALKGIMPEVSELIWNDIESFGVYGFNKSHGLAYGMVTYWTAWMKHHYPKEFLTALFQTDEDNIKVYNRECRRLDVALLGPDVNESEADFALINGNIRYGLHGIKYVAGSSQTVKTHRPYSSAADFMAKMVGTKVTKRALEPLILVGALDSIVNEEDRFGLPEEWTATRVALWRMWRSKLKLGIRETAKFNLREKDDPRGPLLDEAPIFEKYRMEFEAYADGLNVEDRAAAEVEFMGENVTTMPFGKWMPVLLKATELFQIRKGIPPFLGANRMMTGQNAMIGGVITDIQLFKVRKEGPNKGREMCNITLEHPIIEDGKVTDIDTQRIVVFPKEYFALKRRLEQDAPVFLQISRLKDGLALNKLYRMDQDL